MLYEVITKELPYLDMPEAEFAKALEGAGLPAPFAALLANSDTGASQGGLFDDSHMLSSLIGHPTQSLRQLVKAFL